MAVEIIKPGRKPEDTRRQFTETCHACECEFTFHEEDCTTMRVTVGDDYRVVDCPECRTLIKVS